MLKSDCEFIQDLFVLTEGEYNEKYKKEEKGGLNIDLNSMIKDLLINQIKDMLNEKKEEKNEKILENKDNNINSEQNNEENQKN